MADGGGVEKIAFAAVAKTDEAMKEIDLAVRKLAAHALMETPVFVIMTFFKSVACVAAIYLLVLDRTNWRTKLTTALLVPYIFFTLPNLLFFWFRSEVWKWIAIAGVALRLFFPKYYRERLEIPGAVVVIMLVAPDSVVYGLKDGEMGFVVCLGIACYLLHEHVQASGGMRSALRGADGISNTAGIICLFLYPLCHSFLRFIAGIGYY